MQYLKAAFLLRLQAPLLGGVPVNILGLLGFLMLGFAVPGFWLLGLGLEALFLYLLASNKRFRRWVDSGMIEASEEEFAGQWKRLVSQLNYQRQQRLSQLERKCDQTVEKYRDSGTVDYVVSNNQDVLRKLAWIYLKLLIAQTNLESLDKQSSEAQLKSKIAQLQKELNDESIPASARESKRATIEILEKRVENFDKRETSLQEIESDLNRIEAQIDLALENATMQGQPQAISANIDLFSRSLDDRFFGESASTIASIDQTIRTSN